MFKWLKSLFRTYPDCNCAELANFTEVRRVKYNTFYMCNSCTRKHAYWNYDGGTFYINPVMEKWAMNQSLKTYNDFLEGKTLEIDEDLIEELLMKLNNDT